MRIGAARSSNRLRRCAFVAAAVAWTVAIAAALFLVADPSSSFVGAQQQQQQQQTLELPSAELLNQCNRKVPCDESEQPSCDAELNHLQQLLASADDPAASSRALQLHELIPGSLVAHTSANSVFKLTERLHLAGDGRPVAVVPRGRLATWWPEEDSEGTTALTAHLPGARGVTSFPIDRSLHRVLSLPELTAPPGALDHDRDHAVATMTTATIHPTPLSDSPPASASTISSEDDGAPSKPQVDHEYQLRDRVGRGHFGEVWRARRVDSTRDSDETFVLKRLFVEKGLRTRLSGRREVHFGLKLRGVEGVARLIEWFEEGAALWLVFRDEGTSLTHWLTETDQSGQVQPSENWMRMKLQMGRPAPAQQRPTDRADSTDESSNSVTVTTSSSSDATSSPSFGPFLPSPPPSTISLVNTRAEERHDDSALALRKQQQEATSAELPQPSVIRAGNSELPRPDVISPRSDRSLQARVSPEAEQLTDPSSDAFRPPAGSTASSPSSSSFPRSDTPRPPMLANFEHDELRSILYQLLRALAEMHSRGAMHRDVKPANILLRASSPKATATNSPGDSTSQPAPMLSLRLCDLGSAIDSDPSLNALLYPARYAPSLLDNTLAYAPPEVVFSPGTPYSSAYPHSYDQWSVGIVALEAILGGLDHVWQLEPRVRARIERRVEEAFEAEQRAFHRPNTKERRRAAKFELQRRKEKAVLFRAFVEFGIYVPESPTPNDTPVGASASSRSQSQSSSAEFSGANGGCTDERFQQLLQQHDPLGIGAPNPWLVKLIRRLLQWHPALRLSAAESLTHSFFLDRPHRCPICQREFELEREVDYHTYTQHRRHPFV